MAGILSNTPMGALDPQSTALLQMGLSMMGQGPSRMPVSFGQSLGQAGMQGMQAFGQAQQGQQQQQLFAMKMAEAQRAEEERKRREAAQAELMQNPEMARFAPFIKAGLPMTSVMDHVMPKPKAAEPFTLTPGAKRYGPNGEVIAEAAEKAEKPKVSDLALLTAERDALPPNHPNRPLYEAKIRKLTTHQPGTNVTVQPDNLGLKPKDRFDMEDKLRNDFRAHPTVKASDEMTSAFRLIETAKKAPSPANDLAMATKYMKILDPGSVVRESELAMAMNTSGLFDRVSNYAQNILSGQKLTPTQREDFYNSAKAINDAFQGERNNIAEKFKGNATQYNLNPENVIGASPKPSEPTAPMVSKPPASKHKGRIIEDGSGKRFKSDGMSWRPV